MTAPQVDYLSPEVAAMRARAAVCQTVYGGTVAMREAGKTYLPQWPQENDAAWTARKGSSVLYPAFKKAVGVLIGKPLGQPIGIGDDVPTRIEKTLENVDREGRDLDAFARDVAQATLRDGITWVLADFPPVPQGSTLADERRVGANPYLIHIPLANVLGWQRNEAGRLVQFRYLEVVKVPDGPWATKDQARVRVWTPGQVEVWAKGEAGWVSLGPTPVSLQEIPVVAIYGQRTGNWRAEPPLEDLAWLNVKHWQVDSDKGVSLHHACVPLKAADEDTREDPNAPLKLSADNIIIGLKNLRYVEHSGTSISAARQELLDIEDQMRRVVGELLSRVVQKTATEANLESTEGESWLRAWARTFEDALEECLRLMAAWIGEKQGGSLSLDMDWTDAGLAADMLTALTNARTAGEISRESYLTQLKDGRILPAGRTVQQEMDALEMEGPKLDMGMGTGTLP